MRILFTGDWQAVWGNLDKCRAALAQSLDIIRRNHVDVVVHLGDIKEVLNPVDQRVTNFLVDAVHQIKELAPLYVLRGNHDQIGMSETSGNCFPVLAAAGANTIEDPEVIQLGKLILCAVPFRRDESDLVGDFEKVWKDSRELRRKGGGPCILIFHSEIQSAVFGSGVASVVGTSLSVMHAAKYDLCMGGHIHKPQRMAPNTYYVGSPFAQDWGEVNQRKRFLLYDGAVGVVRSLPSKIPGYYDPSLKGFEESRPRSFSGARIRSIVYSDEEKSAASQIDEERSRLEKAYPGAKIDVRVEKSDNSKSVVEVSGSMSDSELVEAYLSKNCPVSQSAAEIAGYLIHQLERTGTLRRSFEGLHFTAAAGKNVLSFRDVSLKLDDKGITLITGRNNDWSDRSNGSGKTSLLQLPVIAMFGRTLKGQQFDKWGSKFATKKESSWVSLDFILPDGRKCRIYRQRHPNKLMLTMDGKDVSSGIGNRDTQKSIEFLTGLSWGVLSSTLYIDQQGINKLLAGTDKERKEIFSQFLHLERFDQAASYVKEEAKSVKLVMVATDSALRLIAQRKDLAEDFLASVGISRLAKTKKLVQNLEIQYKKISGRVGKMRVDSGLRVARNKLADMQSSIPDLYTEIAHLDGLVSGMKVQVNKASNLRGMCPVCKQAISKDTLQAHVSGIQKEIKALMAERKPLQQELVVSKKAIGDLDNTIHIMEREIQVAEKDLVSVDADLAASRYTLEEEEKKLKVIQQYSDIISQAVEGVQIHTQYLKDLSADLAFLNASAYIFSRNGIPAFLAAEICPRLSVSAGRYSQLFTDGEIQVKFQLTDDGDIDVGVINEHGGESLEDQSQGETRMASLVTAFALREIMVPCNVLVLDEPGEGMDGVNARAFSRGLSDVSSRFGHVLVTTHNPHIEAGLRYDRRIQVEKQNGISEAHTG